MLLSSPTHNMQLSTTATNNNSLLSDDATDFLLSNSTCLQLSNSTSLQLDDPLVFRIAAGHLLFSNLATWLMYYYLRSRPLLSRTIITQLNTSLVFSYNLNTSFVSLSLLLRASLGPLPEALAAAYMFVHGVLFFCLVGLHVAIALIRYASVLCFSCIHAQDYRRMGFRINVFINVVSLAVVSSAFLLKDAPNKAVGIEAYLSGRPVHKGNLRLIPLVVGCTTLIGLVLFYLACKWALRRQATIRVQPAREGRATLDLIRHIDAKSIVIGSFYALACCGLSTALDDYSFFRKGIALTIIWLHLNNCVLVYFLSRPSVRSYLWTQGKKQMSQLGQIFQDWWESQPDCGSMFSIMPTTARLPTLRFSNRVEPAVFIIMPDTAVP